MALRRLCAWICLPLLATGAVRLIGYQGLLTPVRVSGGSMAEALAGEHYQTVCEDCGYGYRYDAHDPPGDGRLVCPNCGFVGQHRPNAVAQSGQRVWIDRLAYRWRQPRRWEIVALRTGPDRLEVKRIVGLPGESIEIRRGELYVHGQLVQKSLAELRQLALLVHDHDYQPGNASDARWRPHPGGQGWCAQGGQLRYDAPAASAAGLEWVCYEHWPCFAGYAPPRRAAPVLDNYAYNQNISRQLQTVQDRMLVCRLRVPVGANRMGRVAFETVAGGTVFQVLLDLRRRTGILMGGPDRLSEFALPAAAYARGVKIELAACDRRLLFAIDEQPLIRHDCGAAIPHSDGEQSPPMFRVGAAGGAAVIDRLQVWRDIHYLDPGLTGWPWQMRGELGAGEVLVLGDNVPISVDSRHWVRPAVRPEELLGPVVRAPLAGGLRRPVSPPG